jgi:hypothetical protein
MPANGGIAPRFSDRGTAQNAAAITAGIDNILLQILLPSPVAGLGLPPSGWGGKNHKWPGATGGPSNSASCRLLT